MSSSLYADSKSQDASSFVSMHELDPSPEDDDSSPDLESGEYVAEEERPRTCGIAAHKLGLRAYRWDALRG